MAVAVPLVFGIGGQVLGGWVGGSVGAIIGGVGGAYLGSLMFPQESPSTSLPKIDSYQTQTTLSGSAIPIVRGTCRVAGNVIYLGDPHPYQVVSKTSSGGKGFGGGSDDVVSTQTRYRRSFLIGICEGPATIGKMWRGKEAVLTSCCTIFNGDGNTGLAATTGLEFGYWKYLCCAWFEEYDLGTADSVPLFTFEVNCDVEFRICDIVAAGPAVDIGGTDSVAEMCDIEGNFSHIMLKQTYFSITVNQIKFDGNSNFYFANKVGSSGILSKIDSEGNEVWSNGLSCTDCHSVYVDDDGYIYSAGGYTYPTAPDKVRKFDPDGNEEWSVLPSNNRAWCIIGSGDGNIYVSFISNLSGSYRRIYKLDASDGSTLFYTAPNTYLEGRIAFDGEYFLYSTSHSTSPRVCITPSESSKYYGGFATDWLYVTFPGAVSVKGIHAVVSTDELYLTYFYVGVNYASTFLVCLFGLTEPFMNPSPPPDWFDPSAVALKTYDVGATINDIIVDVDGGILVCHDLGTGEGGEVAHITKLSTSLSLQGYIQFDNDRAGFIRTAARGNGSVIGVSSPETVNPLDFEYDIMTNERYAGGINTAIIDMDTFMEARQYCEDNNLKIALALDNQQPLLDWLDYLNSHYHGYQRMG